MRDKTRKIDKVVSLAAFEERSFGEQVGRAQRSLSEQQERLGELNAYRQNYEKKLPDLSGRSVAHWQDYQNFLHRLDNAVRSQQQIISDCEQNTAVLRERWMVKRQKLESLERVLEKCREQDAVYAARLEQKRLDDIPKSTQTILKN